MATKYFLYLVCLKVKYYSIRGGLPICQLCFSRSTRVNNNRDIDSSEVIEEAPKIGKTLYYYGLSIQIGISMSSEKLQFFEFFWKLNKSPIKLF